MGGILFKILLNDNKNDFFKNNNTKLLKPNMMDTRNNYNKNYYKNYNYIKNKISKDYVVISKQEKITTKYSNI